jgi:hypothetical protein
LRWHPRFVIALRASRFGVLVFWCFGVLVFALAFAICLRASGASRLGVFRLCAGIRELLARFTRRPCAGRHLLFFAAAKKSRQKKAAHTANS